MLGDYILYKFICLKNNNFDLYQIANSKSIKMSSPKMPEEKYEIIKKIGISPYGQTFLVKHNGDNKIVCIFLLNC